MSLQELLHAIEGHQFAAELNLASGWDAFNRVLRDHQLFRELVSRLKEPMSREAVVKRLGELAVAPFDLRYENPFDTALTAYLTALSDVERPERLEVSIQAVSSAMNCWWAKDCSTRLQSRIIRERLLNGCRVQSHKFVGQAIGLGSSRVMMSALGTASGFNGNAGVDASLGSRPGQIARVTPRVIPFVRGPERSGNAKDRGSKRP